MFTIKEPGGIVVFVWAKLNEKTKQNNIEKIAFLTVGNGKFEVI